MSYQLELDLRVHYTPLMDEAGPGISLTRTIQLPFVPTSRVALTGASLERAVPLGYRLKNIIWDVDRQVFLAHTEMGTHGDPIALIPDDLQSMLGEGWLIGSWRQYYDPDWKSSIGINSKFSTLTWMRYQDGELEAWETTASNKRPRKFNEMLRAIVRMLVGLHNNLHVAYAIYKTKIFVALNDDETPQTPEAKKFRAAMDKYLNLDDEKQFKWMARVRRECPTLADVSRRRFRETRYGRSRARRSESKSPSQ